MMNSIEQHALIALIACISIEKHSGPLSSSNPDRREPCFSIDDNLALYIRASITRHSIDE